MEQESVYYKLTGILEEYTAFIFRVKEYAEHASSSICCMA
jgi:hypothetical protein